MGMSDADLRSHPRPSTAGTILYLLVGPITWSAHFALLYFVQSMLCAHGLAGRGVAGVGIVPAFITVATAAALTLLLAAIFAPDAASRLARADSGSASDRSFRRKVMAALALLSAFGVAWAGLAAFVIPACPQLR